MQMHPEHVPLTAASTLFGLYKWLVMPIGLRNASAIQQHQVTAALHEYISKNCHVYLNDIVIWSELLEEHHKNVSKILEALWKACMFVNLKKSHLCYTSNFLGHHTSAKGINADSGYNNDLWCKNLLAAA